VPFKVFAYQAASVKVEPAPFLGVVGLARGARMIAVAVAFAGCGQLVRRAVPERLRTAANALDGLVAEESGLGRPAGELYNKTADRLGDVAFLAGAAAVPGVPPALALGALAAAELSSFVGIGAKAAGGTRRYDGPMGKPDRMLALGAAGLVAATTRRPARALNAGLALIAVGALATAANRYRRAHAELEARSGA